MEGPDPAFFLAARHFGINHVVICLTEQPHLEWNGRVAYMFAKMERRRTELYAMDLIWAIAKSLQDVQLPPPTSYELKDRHTPQRDERSAEQIKQDLLRKLRE